ncbi:S8 family serine peptidase [Acidobacteriota bacterium]
MTTKNLRFARVSTIVFILVVITFLVNPGRLISSDSPNSEEMKIQKQIRNEVTNIQGNSTSRRGPNGDDSTRVIVMFQDWYDDEVKQWEKIMYHKGWVAKSLGFINGMAAYIHKDDKDALAACAEVLSIEEDLDVFSMDDDKSSDDKKSGSEVIPWGIEYIGAPAVWKNAKSGDKVKVGLLDSGVDYKHDDIKKNIKKKTNAINLIGPKNDEVGHGTHMAGIIAAEDNKIGVVGVAPKADIHSVKVIYPDGTGWVSDLIYGLAFCIKYKVDVINMSLGTDVPSAALEAAIEKVHEAGIIMIAAAGNDGKTYWPAAYEKTISVGTFVMGNGEIQAPGTDIYSTWPNDEYNTISGSSCAAAHVTGVVALMFKLKVEKTIFDINGNKDWELDEIRNCLNYFKSFGLGFQIDPAIFDK